MRTIVLVALCASAAFATTAMKETFDNMDGWVVSKHKSDYGEWKLSAGKFYGDAEDKGLQTSQDARFYSIAKKFDKKVSNKGKTLVVQFSVKHEQDIDCGGGYVKLMPSTADLADFHGDTEYNIMFGPDICGPSNKKVHVIFNYKGKNLLTKKDIRCKDDVYTHVYTLIVTPDNKYEVLIDNEKVESGELEADWDFLPPKKIKDPDQSKPDDWVDNEMMDDPNDEMPAGWNDEPEHVRDPDAVQPSDWDDEMDGEWEAPMIDNPAYKGVWQPKKIKNPDYKGPWVHPEIDNPDYQADTNIYLYNDFGALGIDIWQVKSGTIFDNIIVTDDPAEAKAFAEETWGKTKDAEKKMREEQEKEAEEKRKAEEEAAAAAKKDEGEEEADADDDSDEAKSGHADDEL